MICVLTVQTLIFFIDLSVALSTQSLCVSVSSLEDNFCSNISTAVIAQSAMSVTMDIGVLSIPIYQVSRLALDPRRKANIIALFSVGFMWGSVRILFRDSSFDDSSVPASSVLADL